MPPTLTPAERQSLKTRAHPLQPVVMIGGGGLSDAVMREIERALAAHELIKIRVSEGDRERRDALLTEISERTSAAPVQQIGRILVLYRPRPADPKPEPAPKRRPRPAAKGRRVAAGGRAKRSSNRPPPRGAKIRSR